MCVAALSSRTCIQRPSHSSVYDVAELANDVSSVLPAPHAQPIALEREYVMYKVNVLLITETLLPSVA